MDQSTVIFLSLFVAFIVFITMRGDLQKYIALFISPSAPNPQASTPSGGTGGAASGAGGSANANPVSAIGSLLPIAGLFL